MQEAMIGSWWTPAILRKYYVHPLIRKMSQLTGCYYYEFEKLAK